MSEEELRIAILTEPFEPVRIHLTNGSAFDVERNGSIAIGKRSTAIVANGTLQIIANLHVAHIERLVPAA
jgi:hypothetical protein